jgi:hypothetical protein
VIRGRVVRSMTFRGIHWRNTHCLPGVRTFDGNLSQGNNADLSLEYYKGIPIDDRVDDDISIVPCDEEYISKRPLISNDKIAIYLDYSIHTKLPSNKLEYFSTVSLLLY